MYLNIYCNFGSIMHNPRCMFHYIQLSELYLHDFLSMRWETKYPWNELIKINAVKVWTRHICVRLFYSIHSICGIWSQFSRKMSMTEYKTFFKDSKEFKDFQMLIVKSTLNYCIVIWTILYDWKEIDQFIPIKILECNEISNGIKIDTVKSLPKKEEL